MRHLKPGYGIASRCSPLRGTMDGPPSMHSLDAQLGRVLDALRAPPRAAARGGGGGARIGSEVGANVM